MQPEWSKMDLKSHKTQTKMKVDFQPKKRKNKTLGYRSQDGRLVNTKAYAIAWGVINKPYSRQDLSTKCSKDPQSPSFYFIVNKCWKGYADYYNALVRAGMQPRPPRTDMQKRKMLGKVAKDGFKNGLLDKDYDVARLAAQYNVTTKQSYIKIRREHPEYKVFFPNVLTIVKRFGTWRRFQYQIMKYNTDLVLTEYVTKSAQAGHWLRLKECDKLNIPIRGIMDILRPTLFNVLCYRKLDLIGKRDSIKSKE